MTALIDSHCHFDFAEFDSDRDAVWHHCVEKKRLVGLVIPGVSPKQTLRAKSLAENYSGVFFAVGLHPWWVNEFLLGYENIDQACAVLESQLIQIAAHPRCVAVGECGLDKLIDVPLAKQQIMMTVQCNVANSLNKPLIVHSVKTHDMVYGILKTHGVSRGVVHAFSGSTAQAENFSSIGFAIGVGGTITYERAKKTRDAIKNIAIDSLVLETDAPDMPLCGRQGQRNSPEFLPDIARELALVRNEPFERICAQTCETTRQIFGI